MAKTLCKQLMELDEKESEWKLGSDKALEIQKDIFLKYKYNSVLDDAINGEKTIEESLLEAGRVNLGIKKLLPRQRDKKHNIQIIEIGQLITEPSHLYSSGVLWPDNFLGGTISALCVYTALDLAFLDFAVIPFMNKFPDSKMNFYDCAFNLYYVALCCSAPVVGLLSTTKRFDKLPIDQAKYLDKKIESVYHKK